MNILLIYKVRHFYYHRDYLKYDNYFPNDHDTDEHYAWLNQTNGQKDLENIIHNSTSTSLYLIPL